VKKSSKNRLTTSTHLSRKPANADDWISQAEAARIRGVSRQAISRLIQKGRFKTLEIGGRVLVKKSEVDAFEPEQPGRPRK
jgi:excisionase family DNA binding protein